MVDFRKLFDSTPDAYLVLEPREPYPIIAVNDAYLRLTSTERGQLLGRAVFEIFPDNPATPDATGVRNLRASLERVVASRQPHSLACQRYDIRQTSAPDSPFQERFWRVWNVPLLTADSEVEALVQRVEDITSVVQLERAERAHADRNEALQATAAEARREAASRATELRRVHDQLRDHAQRLLDTEARLAAAGAAGELGTWIWEPQTNRVFADDTVARWYSVPPDAAHGGSLDAYLSVVHPDDVAAVRAAIDRTSRERAPLDIQYRIRHAHSSEWRWILARAKIDDDPRERPGRLVGVVLDTTELWQAKRALHETQEQLQMAADAAEIGSFSWTIPPGDLQWDARCKAHFWLPPDAEANMQLFYSILHPDDRERTRDAVEQAITGQSGFDIEYRTVSAEGRIRWVHAKGRVHHDPGGEATRFDGITLDVTRQKQIETELSESEARYRLVVESLHEHAIFMLNDEGIITHWNQGAARLLGYADDEIVGRPMRMLFTPEDQARGEPERELETAKSTGAATDDRWHVRRDGSRFFVTGLLSAVTDGTGRRIGFAKIMRDITDRQTAAAEREQLLQREQTARAEAERTSRLKDEFLATLSHELRTPLNAILGWTQILKGGDLEPNDLAQGLEVIDRNTRIQVQLIEDLLDMSRIISGKVRLNVQTLLVVNVVNAAMDSVRSAAEAKNIRLGAVYHGAGATVMGDPNRLQQVVWNLLSNAIKFTPPDGRVDVSVLRGESSVTIAVTDNGEGVAPEFLPHVFERFRQADASTTRPHSGLGLGLAIVKHLVELHGGRVAVESPGEGRGATFTLTIPSTIRLPVDAQLPVRPPPPAPATAPVAADLRGVKVLVVDDEADSAGLAKRVLEGQRAEVRLARSMTEALEVFDEFHPDVLLSDIGMPQHDGYELIRRVRSLPQGRGVPAAALTALARSADRARALEAGFHTHVSKPVEPAELIAVVARLAERRPPP